MAKYQSFFKLPFRKYTLLCFFPFDENEKGNLFQVMFTIRQRSSKSVVGKISRSSGVKWR